MDVKKYFDRLGLELPEMIVPDSELLRKVHLAHCCRVPYENLDMIRGIPTSLEEDALFRKIVEEGKGGICFELNGSLGNLLRALGYQVTDYAARYLRGESTLPMRRHRVPKVEATDGVWLCDVGVGEVCQREPVALVEGLEQHQFGETYKLTREEFLGWVLWDFHKGAWRKFYSFTEEPQLVADFIAGNFYCEKHPLFFLCHIQTVQKNLPVKPKQHIAHVKQNILNHKLHPFPLLSDHSYFRPN